MIRSEVAVHQEQSVLLQQPIHGKGVILDVCLLVGINEDDVKLLPHGLHLLHLLVRRADNLLPTLDSLKPCCANWAISRGMTGRCQGRPYPRPWPEPTSHARHEHVLLLSQRGDLLQVGGGEASLAHGIALNLRVEQGELVIVRG